MKRDAFQSVRIILYIFQKKLIESIYYFFLGIFIPYSFVQEAYLLS